MSFKVVAVAALLASVASAKPFAKRAGPGSVAFTNNIGDTIPYVLVGEGGNIQSGSFAPGSTTGLPMSPDKAGYSLKLAAPGGNPSASSGILQFEYTYNTDEGGIVTYDWSCVNCNPDPYTAYTRTITPADIGSQSSCQVETCAAGVDSDSCEYIGTTDYNPGTCATTGGVVLTASIS